MGLPARLSPADPYFTLSATKGVDDMLAGYDLADTGASDNYASADLIPSLIDLRDPYPSEMSPVRSTAGFSVPSAVGYKNLESSSIIRFDSINLNSENLTAKQK